MCEMLGISAKERKSVNCRLKEFFSHARQHPHGWGLARFRDDGLPLVEKEPVCALESAYLKERLESEMTESSLVAHIRLATVGAMEYDNCHPFFGYDISGRVWTLVHNGTIFHAAELNQYAARQKGRTDSERVLLHLLDCMNAALAAKGGALDAKERFAVVVRTIERLSRGNKLNLLIYDGETMYAHCNFKDTLHWRQDDGEIVFSTQPLGDGGFASVPFCRAIAVKNGEVAAVGPAHGNEYIYNPDDYRLVYMDFANL
ncbi:MAG: class II glutamine amidotransferase [Kiritimatiellia bacterium]